MAQGLFHELHATQGEVDPGRWIEVRNARGDLAAHVVPGVTLNTSGWPNPPVGANLFCHIITYAPHYEHNDEKGVAYTFIYHDVGSHGRPPDKATLIAQWEQENPGAGAHYCHVAYPLQKEFIVEDTWHKIGP